METNTNTNTNTSTHDEEFEIIQVGNDKCEVNRNMHNLQQIYSFDDLLPFYNDTDGFHLKITENGKTKTEKINKRVIEYTKIPGSQNMSRSEYCQAQCSIKHQQVQQLVRNIYSTGFEKPSEVQMLGILPLINGSDCVIQFKSGTGKTHTFLLGLLWGLDTNNKSLQYLILTSTHEVATQIYDHVIKLVSSDVKVSLCIGAKKQTGGFKSSKPISTERAELSAAQIIVGTVGKTYEYLCVKFMIKSVSGIKAICMDEFDQLVTPQKNKNSREIKTEDQIKAIVDKMPAHAQRVFFSATRTEESDSIVASYFRPYNEETEKPFILVLQKDNYLLSGIKHYYVVLGSLDNKCDAIVELLNRMRISQLIIFVNSTHAACMLTSYLSEQEIPIPSIAFHGTLSSVEREKIYSEFKSGKFRLLVATDVLARGIDVHTINAVINFDMPNALETYIHRIGRCGRHGRKGVAINFVLANRDTDEMLKVNEINMHGGLNQMTELPQNIEDLL